MILETVVSSCTCKAFDEYNKLLCAEIAKVHQEDKIFTKAYNYSLRACNLQGSIKAVEEVMK